MEGKSYPHPAPPPAYDFNSGQQSHQPYHPPPMQQPPMQHTYHVPAPTVINVEPTQQVFIAPNVGPDPTMVTCPSCRNTVVTRLEYEPTTRTHICAGLLCLFGCWLCVCLPYCCHCGSNVNHYCPSCGTFIRTYYTD